MNKKFIPIAFVFIIVISAVILYVYFSQSDTGENGYDNSIETIDDEDIQDEFDDFFLEEDDEVEIGEMV